MSPMKDKHPRAFVCVSHSPLMTIPALADFGSEFRKNLTETKSFIEEFCKCESKSMVYLYAFGRCDVYIVLCEIAAGSSR